MLKSQRGSQVVPMGTSDTHVAQIWRSREVEYNKQSRMSKYTLSLIKGSEMIRKARDFKTFLLQFSILWSGFLMWVKVCRREEKPSTQIQFNTAF